MTGASSQTARVDYLNANWKAHSEDESAFELLVVTEDGIRHAVPIPAAQLAALGPVLRKDNVLLFDPENETLIIGNIVGEWFQSDWQQGAARHATPAR